jgi:hypothetical protein
MKLEKDRLVAQLDTAQRTITVRGLSLLVAGFAPTGWHVTYHRRSRNSRKSYYRVCPQMKWRD